MRGSSERGHPAHDLRAWLTGARLRRALAFVVLALVLYGLAPALVAVFSSWPQVAHIAPVWFGVMVVAQAASLWCLAKLQALTMAVCSTRTVLGSTLVSGALGRVLPGGTATAAATQYELLLRAGVPGQAIGLGLTAGTLLQLAALCALPVLAVPAVALGTNVPTTLAAAAAVAAVVFVAMVALSAFLMHSDRALRAVGRRIDAIRRRLRRGAAPPGDLADRLVVQRDEIVLVLHRRWKLALAVTAGRWLFDFITLEAALVAIGAHASLALTLFAYSAAQLIGQLPLTPGGLGVVEAGLTGSLTLAGASAAEAAVATLAYRLVSYWLVIVAGLVAWLYRRRSRSRSAGGSRVSDAHALARDPGRGRSASG